MFASETSPLPTAACAGNFKDRSCCATPKTTTGCIQKRSARAFKLRSEGHRCSDPDFEEHGNAVIENDAATVKLVTCSRIARLFQVIRTTFSKKIRTIFEVVAPVVGGNLTSVPDKPSLAYESFPAEVSAHIETPVPASTDDSDDGSDESESDKTDINFEYDRNNWMGSTEVDTNLAFRNHSPFHSRQHLRTDQNFGRNHANELAMHEFVCINFNGTGDSIEDCEMSWLGSESALEMIPPYGLPSRFLDKASRIGFYDTN